MSSSMCPSKTLVAVLLIAVSLMALAGCLHDGSPLDGTHLIFEAASK